MTKVLKYVAVGLAAIVGLNLLMWAFVGHDSILLQAPLIFDHSCPIGELDTLLVYARYTEDAETPEVSTVGDFSNRARRALFDSLGRRSQSVIEYRDETTDVFPKSPDDAHFGVWIDRRYPMHADLIAGETALGFGASYDQHWVWLFGWRPVGFASGGCS